MYRYRFRYQRIIKSGKIYPAFHRYTNSILKTLYMKKVLVAIVFSLACISTFAQSAEDRARMEKERQAIQKELKEIQGVYEQVKGQKKETLGQLNLLQKKMNLQGRYIVNINKEIKIINDEIYLSTLELNKLQNQLDTLKSQYARSVVYAYKNSSTYDYLNFIFSASSFNDALRRIAYLKSYRTYRQQQVAEILQTQKLIAQRKDELMGKKTQKGTALQNQEKQLDVLADQKKEKDAVVSTLKSKESELSKQIAARKKKDAQLQNAISAIIRREIEARRKAAEEAERKRREAEALAAANKAKASKENTSTTTKDNNTATTTPAAAPVKAAPKKEYSAVPLNEKEVALSNNFASNKGKLPWPVDNGYVSIHFGTYEVPGTSIKGDNPYITISTPSAGTPVKAVFDGEVIGVFNLGDQMAVTISHGKYFTTYSNLSGVSVSKGASVRTGQTVGQAAADDEGGSDGKVNFMLMIGQNNVNPEPWLRGR